VAPAAGCPPPLGAGAGPPPHAEAISAVTTTSRHIAGNFLMATLLIGYLIEGSIGQWVDWLMSYPVEWSI
jgi:hypothetical protein